MSFMILLSDCAYDLCTAQLENSVRNYRPSFRENKPKTLVLYD
jgi:hypothetical protein